jgi:hypothetical protein
VAALGFLQRSNLPIGLNRINEVITVKEAAAKFGVSVMRIRQLLRGRRIRGARKLGPIWVTPDGAVIAKAKNPRGRPARKAR